MRTVYIIGVSSTKRGKIPDKNVFSLTEEALEMVVQDAEIRKKDIQSAIFSNFAWGSIGGQHSIRGEVALRRCGIDRIPITNVENACASGSTALHTAWKDVALGLTDVSLAIGTEKLYSEDKTRAFLAISSACDIEKMSEQLAFGASICAELIPPGYATDMAPVGSPERSSLLDIYSGWVRFHMQKYGTTLKQLATVASKNHWHASRNPKAQYQKTMTVEEVLSDKMISWPLTRAMCSPISDASAAAILCSGDFLRRLSNARAVKVRASILGSGTNRPVEEDTEDIAYRVAKQAYEVAGLGPEDVDVAEVHDASAYGEIHGVEALAFCRPGEGGPLAESGATTLGGKIPINVSGGLESNGHPIGATGLVQIYELVLQLRGEAGARQVKDACIAVAENGGGSINNEEAAMCIHILERFSK